MQTEQWDVTKFPPPPFWDFVKEKGFLNKSSEFKKALTEPENARNPEYDYRI